MFAFTVLIVCMYFANACLKTNIYIVSVLVCVLHEYDIKTFFFTFSLKSCLRKQRTPRAFTISQ